MLYLFEGYALDTDRRELRRGDDLLPVEPKVFDLLVYVIRNRERVVSKDDLIDTIWDGRIVSESALTTCINAARTAIGDSGEAQRLIKTLPRKGIRFVGTVRDEPTGPKQARAGPQPGASVVVRAEARAACVLMGEDEGAIRSALHQGRELVVSNLESGGGRIIPTPADTVIAVFSDAATAVSMARRTRDTLANCVVAVESRVHYRFGVAIGELQEGADGPSGPAVERAAMVALAAHPDAVQLSEAIQAALPGSSTSAATKSETGKPTDSLPAQLQSLDLALPARPSIVLLPFKAVGDNQEESVSVAEGLRIDIQNALTKMSGVFLVGAGSANAMRGWPAAEAAERASVQHVLEGAVQQSGGQVRVSVQLTDTIAGTVLWSELYDRTLDDKFVLQDEITQRIVTALDVKLASGEQARIWHKGLTDPKAREAFYREFGTSSA